MLFRSDADIWEYIKRFNVPYSPLYDVAWVDAEGTEHKIPRNGCMPCGTDLLYPNNHLATLRRTHNRAWKVFMGNGLGEEIRKLQCTKRSGQMCLMDYFPVNYLIEERQCAFDRIDRVVMYDKDDEGMTDYDAEEDNNG